MDSKSKKTRVIYARSYGVLLGNSCSEHNPEDAAVVINSPYSWKGSELNATGTYTGYPGTLRYAAFGPTTPSRDRYRMKSKL